MERKDLLDWERAHALKSTRKIIFMQKMSTENIELCWKPEIIAHIHASMSDKKWAMRYEHATQSVAALSFPDANTISFISSFFFYLDSNTFYVSDQTTLCCNYVLIIENYWHIILINCALIHFFM